LYERAIVESSPQKVNVSASTHWTLTQRPTSFRLFISSFYLSLKQSFVSVICWVTIFLLNKKKRLSRSSSSFSPAASFYIKQKKAIGLSDCFVSCSLVPFRFTSSMQIRLSFVVTK